MVHKTRFKGQKNKNLLNIYWNRWHDLAFNDQVELIQELKDRNLWEKATFVGG